MHHKMRSLTKLCSLCVAVFAMGSLPLHGAEQSVQFSGFVPAKSGDLAFGPVKAYAEGIGQSAGLQLTAGNDSAAPARVHFESFDAHFNPVNDVDLPKATVLYPGEIREFLAVVPIMRDVKRRYRICAILSAKNKKQTRMCGKYIAQSR